MKMFICSYPDHSTMMKDSYLMSMTFYCEGVYSFAVHVTLTHMQASLINVHYIPTWRCVTVYANDILAEHFPVQVDGLSFFDLPDPTAAVETRMWGSLIPVIFLLLSRWKMKGFRLWFWLWLWHNNCFMSGISERHPIMDPVQCRWRRKVSRWLAQNHRSKRFVLIFAFMFCN